MTINPNIKRIIKFNIKNIRKEEIIMDSNFKIRKATIDDVSICSIFIEEFNKEMKEYSSQESQKESAAYIYDKQFDIFLLLEEDIIIGYAIIKYIEDKKQNKLYVYVISIYIKEEERSKGYGTKLLDFLKNILNETYKAIVLAVYVTNVRAQNFYFKNQFYIIGKFEKIICLGYLSKLEKKEAI